MEAPKPRHGAPFTFRAPPYVEPTAEAVRRNAELKEIPPSEVASHPSLLTGEQDMTFLEHEDPEMQNQLAVAFFGKGWFPTAERYLDAFCPEDASDSVKEYFTRVAYELYPLASAPLLEPAQQEAHLVMHEEEVVLRLRAEMSAKLSGPARTAFLEEMSRFDADRVQHRLQRATDPRQVDWDELGRIASRIHERDYTKD